MTARSPKLSVIVRFHGEAPMWQLDQALFSLAHQDYADLEIIVVYQNASAEDVTATAILLQKTFPWIDAEMEAIKPSGRVACGVRWGEHVVASVEVPDRRDGRSILLNEGLALSSGRFIAFLDYDDVVYHFAYTYVTEQLLSSKSKVAIMAAGCRRSHCVRDSFLGLDFLSVHGKSVFLGPEDLSMNAVEIRSTILGERNLLPIHTYILDQEVIEDSDLHFVEGLDSNEDYDLLIRLLAKYELGLADLGLTVSEYRIRLDGSNSTRDIPQMNVASLKEIVWRRSGFFIDQRRKSLGFYRRPEESHQPKTGERKAQVIRVLQRYPRLWGALSFAYRAAKWIVFFLADVGLLLYRVGRWPFRRLLGK